MKISRTASLGSNFTGSYKKVYLFLNCVNIQYTFGGESAFVVVMVSVLKTGVVSDELIG